MLTKLYFMLPILYYFLKVILCSAILFGYYWLALRNKIYHRYNRFYLLAITLLSVSLPLLKFSINTVDKANTSIIKILTVVNGSGEDLDEVVIFSGRKHFDWSMIAIILFVIVSLAMIASLTNALLHIYKLKKRNPVQEIDEIKLITTEDKSTPFSFFKNIFWNNEIDIDSVNGQRILKHELAHVTEQHSLDKLSLNILLIFYWWNPVFWLLRKELNLIHEFIADQKAVEDGDTTAFAEMILAATYPRHQFNLTNNFFYSPIKRRLAMLKKKNKTRINYFSRLMVLPLAAFVFAAFTLKAQKIMEEVKLEKKIVVVIDAGHGGKDNGGMATDGSLEKDINLMLAQKVKELNTNKNIEILLTRNTDIYQSPREKADWSNAQNPDLFISIHAESAPGKSQDRSGLQVFVAKDNYPNATISKLLASAVLESFNKNYVLNVSDTIGQRQMGIWVLQESKCPAVLVESGYLSNKNDLSYLLSAKGQTQFSENILKSIESFAIAKENIYGSIQQQSGFTKEDFEKAKEGTATTSFADRKPIPLGDNEQLKNILIIVNGRVVDNEKIKWQNIKSKSLTVYKENNKVMIKKYGEKARKGVWIFEDAVVKPVTQKASVNERNAYNFTTDSVYIVDASQIEDAPLSPAPELYKNALILINGKVETMAYLKNLNPDRIEKINVLKGKAATTLYGDKGVNGVIEVTTKHLEYGIQDTIPDKIFTQVEHEASFPGGQDAWRKYLETNLNANVPVDAGMKTGTYTVITRFIVNIRGEISDISSETYKGTKMAAECKRAIENGPKWIPARQNGKIVNAYRKQPITFVVQE